MSRGALVLIATPIGNLGDLSPRAIEELARADAIACEDTRRTGRLLKHAGIDAPRLLVVNDHSEAGAARDIVLRIDGGQRVAVVTDAGTPGIADPGERLVRAVLDAGHAVEVVPGPAAAIAALVTSGLPAGRFCFEGFLPRKGAGRAERLASLATERRTIVVYEAPHRIVRTLTDLAEAFGGDRRVSISRELTKLHEETWRGTLADSVAWAEAGVKGEMVIVVDGCPEGDAASDSDIADALRDALAAGASTRDAAMAVAGDLGVARRRVYELATRLRG